MWKLLFTLTIFSQKLRQINVFSTKWHCKLFSRYFSSESKFLVYVQQWIFRFVELLTLFSRKSGEQIFKIPHCVLQPCYVQWYVINCLPKVSKIEVLSRPDTIRKYHEKDLFHLFVQFRVLAFKFHYGLMYKKGKSFEI